MLAAVRGSQRSNHPAPPRLTCTMQAPDLFIHQSRQVYRPAKLTAECSVLRSVLCFMLGTCVLNFPRWQKVL